MRADYEATFDDTAVIYRTTYVSDGQGGGTAAPSAVGTVACRVSPATQGQEAVSGERLTALADVYISVPALTDVRETDSVVVSSVTYQVTSVRAPRTNEIVRKFEATEVS